jgi:hypothetical protein
VRGFLAQADSKEVQTVHSKRYQRNIKEDLNLFEQLGPTTLILDSTDPTPVAPIDMEPPSKEYLKARESPVNNVTDSIVVYSLFGIDRVSEFFKMKQTLPISPNDAAKPRDTIEDIEALGSHCDNSQCVAFI